MNKDYCVLPIGGKSRVLKFAEEIEFYPNHEFRALLDNNKVKVGKKLMGKGSWWLNQPNRRQYDGLVFKPGLDPVVRGKMNLWKGFAIEPKKGDWHLMRKHVSEVVASGNADYEDYIIKWVAWSLQNPGAPAEVVLVLRGGKGTGKGVFAREIKKIFGIHGAQISSVDHLAGRFNAHLMQCAFLFADEAFWPGDKSHEGTLKRMVTERTLFIERKGVDGFEVDNCLHILMAANAEWVVPASMDERRYACFNLIETNKQSDAYFAPLYKEIENGGTAAMLYDMLKMDLQGWHPRQNVPQTDALRMQQEHSLSYVDQWWLSLLEAGALPGRLENNPRRAPSRTLFEHARRDVPGLRFSSDNLLGGVLRAHGCFSFNHAGIRGWTFPSLKDAREEWSVKMPTTWDDPEREDWFEAANWEKEPY